ncbi:MAG: hypothetical protein MZV63_41240 [Marinilabiliales bacterium]|nr:hypothetical protein [Marinilabiliales bacterium]
MEEDTHDEACDRSLPRDRAPCSSSFSLEACAQEKLDLRMLDRIRAEGLTNSQITDFLIYLCDVYAPRLPASPQYVEAGEWVVAKVQGDRAGQRRRWSPTGRSAAAGSSRSTMPP